MAKRLGMRRRMALSMSLGRFVAPRTRIRVSLLVVRPSHMLMNSAFLRVRDTLVSGQEAESKEGEGGDAHHPRHLVVGPAALSQERVDLVDKDDRRLQLAREREERGDELVRLAEPGAVIESAWKAALRTRERMDPPFVGQSRDVHVDECRARLFRQRLRRGASRSGSRAEELAARLAAKERRLTFASIVLPHPGGPYIKTPLGAPNRPAALSKS